MLPEPISEIGSLSASRIESLLRSNDAPLGTERQQICMSLDQLDRELASVDADITKLHEDTSKILHRKRDSLSVQKENLKAASAPIRYLPTKILREIFWNTIAVVNVDAKSRVYSLNVNNAPWLVSYVCRRWRQVALDFHDLWSSVGIAIPKIDTPQATNSSFLLGIQLARSAHGPLDLEIRYSHKSPITAIHPCVIALMPTTLRWRRLVVRADLATYVSLKPIFGILPNLEDVHVRGEHRHLSNFSPSVAVDWFEASFRLETFRCFNLPNPVEIFPLPWDTLKHFWIAASTAEFGKLIQLLNCMVSLESFVLGSIKAEAWIPSDHSKSIDLPKLHRLKLRRSAKRGMIKELFRLLQAPKLEELALWNCDDSTMEAVAEYLRRQKCPLQVLKIQLVRPTINSAKALADMLAAMPEVTELHVYATSSMLDILIRILTVAKEILASTPPLPRLTHLRWFSLHQKEQQSEFLAMVTSRATQLGGIADTPVYCSALRSVHMSESIRKRAYEETLNVCRAAGITLLKR